MKKNFKFLLLGLLLIVSIAILGGCTVVVPPVISNYTVYFNSYDGVSGYLYIDGVNEGYLYPYSYVTVTLSSGSHSVSLNGTFCGYVTPSYNGENFYIDSQYNVW